MHSQIRVLPLWSSLPGKVPNMIFNSDRDRFEVYDCYPLRGRLKARGFNWDNVYKCWWTSLPKIAMHFSYLANEAAAKALLEV